MRGVVKEYSFFDGCFGYAIPVEVSCGTYESWMGRVVLVRKGRHFSRSRSTLMETLMSLPSRPT